MCSELSDGNQGRRTGVAMGDNTTVTIYPISNYSFGSKPPKQEKDNSVGARYVPKNDRTRVGKPGRQASVCLSSGSPHAVAWATAR